MFIPGAMKCNLHTDLVDAASISAGEHVLGARLLLGTVVEGGVLVGAVHAVRIAITNPLLGDALGAAP